MKTFKYMCALVEPLDLDGSWISKVGQDSHQGYLIEAMVDVGHVKKMPWNCPRLRCDKDVADCRIIHDST